MIAGTLEIQLLADIARLQRDMDRANRVVGDATNSMARAADAAKNALAAIGAGMGLAQLVQMSDGYAKFTAQLRLASLSGREYAAAYSDVKRISTQSQQGLQETGVLYARIANGTRELGTTQKQVAAITETVNMALKVSGATASESASAQLQLSQAFASGTLRGEEFNAVNEAAPRLMLALADGMGKPVGALKKMAEEGQITSKIMADVLPNALVKLREEAKQVQTISGAFTVLKNNMMEFVGVQANASGAVAALTGAIGLLSNNLVLIAGSVATLTTAKLATWLYASGAAALKNAADQRLLAASTLATAVTTTEAASVIAVAKLSEARSTAVATGATAALTAARVAELRSTMAVVGADAALLIATTTLPAATLAATAAAEAHAIALNVETAAAARATVATTAAYSALTAQAAAATLAARAMGVLRAGLAMFGGPLGLIVTLLGAAATAWMIYGNKAKESSDKAAAAVDESTVEMIARLDKQIEKLKERNKLQEAEPRLKGLRDLSDADKDGLARAKSKLDAVRAGTGEFADRSVTSRQLAEIDLASEYEKALLRVRQAQDETAKAASRGRAVDLAEWFGTNGTNAQKLAFELDALKVKFGEIPPEMRKAVEAKYADKGAATAIKQEATAYENLITKLNEKLAAGQLEAQGYDKLTEAQKATIELDAAIASGKNKLNAESIKGARAKIAELAALNESNAAQARNAATAKLSSEANASNLETLSATTVQLRAETLAQQDQNARLGLTATAIAELDAQRLEHLATIKEENADLAENIDWTGAMSQAYRDQAAALRERASETRAGATKSAALDVAPAKELLDIMAALDDATKSAAQGMAASFGKIGSAIGGLTTALSGYGRTQAAIAAQLAASTKDAGGDQTKIQKANAIAAQQSAQAQVKSYGDMAGAAKGFFKENSTGYKVMEGTEKAFRAAEMAMVIQNMLAKSGLLTGFTGLFVASKATQTAAELKATATSTGAAGAQASAWGVTAVVKAIASMPFPANLAAGAATLAAVVAIGAKIAGGFGGGSSGGGNSAADMQQMQGTALRRNSDGTMDSSNMTGGVFGDATAKTNSIANAIDMLKANSDAMVPINQGMLAALRNIESSMSGLTNLIVRAPGVANGKGFGVAEGQISKLGAPTDLLSRAGTEITNAFFGPGLGDKIASFINNLYGKTTQKIVDSGISFGGSVRGLQSGQGFNQYASVDTTKSTLFGLSKKTTNSVQQQGLSSELTDQFAKVFTGLEGALTSAAVGLGIGAEHVKKTLDALTIDVTQISLKGLTGDALTEALNAVLSKTMDQMASAVFPDMDGFRQVGEGYAETVIRLASNYATLDSVLDSIGGSFGATGVASLRAREDLIALAGGLDNLASQTKGFAENFLTEAERMAPVAEYVAAEMGRLGLAGVTTRDQFKDAVLGLASSGALATEEGSKTYAALMRVQEAFSLTHPEIEKTGAAVMSAADIMSQRDELQKQYNALTMTATQLEEDRRSKIHDTNKELYDSVIAEQKSADIASERATLQEQLNGLTMSESELLDLKRSKLDATNQALFDEVQAAERSKAVASERLALQDQLNQLTMTEAKLLDLKREKLDASNQALFDEVQAKIASNKLTEINAGWQQKIDQLMLSSAELRKRELSTMEPTTRALAEIYYARLEEKEAAEDAAVAVRNAATAIKSMIDIVGGALAAAENAAKLAMQGVVNSVNADKEAAKKAHDDKITDLDNRAEAARKLAKDESKVIEDQQIAAKTAYDLAIKANALAKKNAVDAYKIAVDKAKAEEKAAQIEYKERTKALAAERDAAVKAYALAAKASEAQIKQATEGLRTLEQASEALHSTLLGLRQVGQDANYRKQAQGTISDALVSMRAGGPLPDTKILTEALRTISQPSEALFASFTDYQKDYQLTANMLKELSDLTDGQLSEAQTQLEILESTRDQAALHHEALLLKLDEQRAALDEANELRQTAFEAQMTAMAEAQEILLAKLDGAKESLDIDYEKITGGFEKQLADIAKQLEESIGAIDKERESADEILRTQLATLDATLELAQKQYDIQMGTFTALAGLPDALKNLAAALGNLVRVQDGTATTIAEQIVSEINGKGGYAKVIADQNALIAKWAPSAAEVKRAEEMYLVALGRKAEGKSAEALAASMKSGISEETAMGWLKSSTEAQARGISQTLQMEVGRIVNARLNTGVNSDALFGINGSHASGLSYVPWDGYIAELHKGEMVVPAAAANEMRYAGGRGAGGGGDSGAVDALDVLIEENKKLRTVIESHLYAIAKNTGQTAETLDDVSNGARAFTTEAA